MTARPGSPRIAVLVATVGWIWRVVWIAMGVAPLSLVGGSRDAMQAAAGSVACGLGGFGMAWALARGLRRPALRGAAARVSVPGATTDIAARPILLGKGSADVTDG